MEGPSPFFSRLHSTNEVDQGRGFLSKIPVIPSPSQCGQLHLPSGVSSSSGSKHTK